MELQESQSSGGEVWQIEELCDACCGHSCTVDGCHESHPSGVFTITGPSWDYERGEPVLMKKEEALIMSSAKELLEACRESLVLFQFGKVNDVRIQNLLERAINKATQPNTK